MAEVLFRAKLTREGAANPWGFRLQGGVEYDKPLTLLKVVEGSLACKGGLHPGDIVVKLAGKSADDMTHKHAQDAIISAGNHLEIIVERAEVTMTTAQTPTSSSTTVSQATRGTEKAETNTTSSTTTSQVPPSKSTSDTTDDQNSTAAKASPVITKPSDKTTETTSRALENDRLAKDPSSHIKPELSVSTGPETPTSKHKRVSDSETPEVPLDSSQGTDSNQDNAQTGDNKSDNVTGTEAALATGIVCDKSHSEHVKVEGSNELTSSSKPEKASSKEALGTSVITEPSTVSISPKTSKTQSQQATDEATQSSSKPANSDIPKALVISGFQSSSQSDPRMAPSCTSSGEKTQQASPSHSAHIPQSSSVDLVSSVAPTPTVSPITMVVTEVPKVTIKGTAVDVRPTESTHVSTQQPSTKVVISQSDEQSIPVPTHIQSSDSTSRQTGAPTEEIMIAPKPTVQIMSSPEHRETIQVPAGDKRNEHDTEGDVEDDLSPLVTHEMKDFSKTAPWRMHKQLSPGSQTESRPVNQAALHPWRKSRSEHAMSHSLDDRQLSAAASRLIEGNQPTSTSEQPNVLGQYSISEMDISVKKPQSMLTYVGKRIESPPVGSPVHAGSPFFKPPSTVTQTPAGRDVPPSDRSNTIPQPHTTLPSTSEPTSMQQPEPTSEVHCPLPEEIHLQAAAPDLVDIPMPAVKEMVENLNKRLEAIAVIHPKIVEPETDSRELGLSYFKQRGTTDSAGHQVHHGDLTEQEIFINTPPNPNFTGTSLDEINQRLFGHPGYYEVLSLIDAGASPASHRRRYSLPGGSVTQRPNQRKVRFAEPPESSVIEIEPRQKRFIERMERRRMWDDDGSMSDMEDYSSASLLAAKLDRIERENALSTASFHRHRNAKQRAQSIASDGAQAKPTETFREKVISFESLGEPKQDDVVLSSMKPTSREKLVFGPSRSGSRGFSLSIGQNKPGSISLSLMHQRGSGHPASQVALSVPSSEGHFTYTISPQSGSSDPVSIRYNVPPHLINEPMIKHVVGEHTKASSLDSARTVHIQYPPQEGVPTIQTQLLNQTSSANPLSPPQQVMRQLAGRPHIRSPTNYSNTLQIDTSSRLQHRSPSPPNPSYPPNIQSDRPHLSPQRLVQPQARHPDAEYQAQRSTSPSQGAPKKKKVPTATLR